MSNATVAHKWAYNTDPNKWYGGTKACLTMRGNRLISFSTAIAAIFHEQKFALISSTRYSVRTSGHQSHASRAVPSDYTKVWVDVALYDRPASCYGYAEVPHTIDGVNRLFDKMFDRLTRAADNPADRTYARDEGCFALKFAKAKNYKSRANTAREWNREWTELRRLGSVIGRTVSEFDEVFAKITGMEYNRVWSDGKAYALELKLLKEGNPIEKVKIRIEEARRKEQERIQREHEERVARELEGRKDLIATLRTETRDDIAKWRSNETKLYYWRNKNACFFNLLRLSEDKRTVQTDGGVDMPVGVARNMLKAVRELMALKAEGANHLLAASNIVIPHCPYRLISVFPARIHIEKSTRYFVEVDLAAGTIKSADEPVATIGCHHIPVAEMERIEKELETNESN